MHRIFLVVALLLFAVGVDVQAQIASGPIIIIRSVKPDEQSVRLVRYGVTREDVRRMKGLLPSAKLVIPIREHPGLLIRVGDRNIMSPVVGTTAKYIHGNDLKVVRGRFLTESDDLQRNNVAVISRKHAGQLFLAGDPIGQVIRLNNEYFTVVGVIESDSDLPVIIPQATMRTRMGDKLVLRERGTFEARHYELSEVQIQLDSTANLDESLEVTIQILKRYHDQDDFQVKVKR